MIKAEPTVFIVDDDPAIRDSLRMLIKRLGLRIQSYACAEAFLEELCPDTPGCLVLDIRMGGMSGIELQEKLIEKSVRTPIIFITGYGDVPTAVRATRQGAVDFIEKPFEQKMLLDRIQQAIEKDASSRQARAQHAEIAERFANLSPREREVMELVIAGKTSREIAIRLCRSEKTIKAHRLHLMKKLRARTSAELVRMYMTVREKSQGTGLPQQGKALPSAPSAPGLPLNPAK